MTLTPEHLATIRTLHALGMTQASLAREYDTTPYTIKRVVCEPNYQPPRTAWRTKQWRQEQQERKWRHRDRGVNAKLTREQARDIKTRLARGERGDAIAAYYGVTESEISLIRRGKRWADVEAMKYRYRLFCPDCTDIDPQGCFDGGYCTDEEAFDTPEEAMKAGYKATLNVIWGFEVVDEEGNVVEAGEEGQRSG